MTPAARRPSAQASPRSPTATGSEPKERLPMTGLSGLLLTSTTGAKSMSTPRALNSYPATRPACRIRSTSSMAPRAMAFREANAVGQPHAGCPFRIHGRQQSDAACGAGEAVEVTKVPCRVGLVPLHGNHTAHTEVHDQRGHIHGAFWLPRLGVERDHHQLGDPRLHVEAVHPRQGGRCVAFEEGRARGQGRRQWGVGGRTAGTPDAQKEQEGTGGLSHSACPERGPSCARTVVRWRGRCCR